MTPAQLPGVIEHVQQIRGVELVVFNKMKQQYPYAMTEEDGHRHLKDHLFDGLKPNLCNALQYLYDKPDSQYRQLVIASRKTKTETLRCSVSEIRAKSTVVGTDTDSQVKGASSKPSYEAITQQIAYLMSAVTNQTHQNLNKNGGCTRSKSNVNGKYLFTTFQRPKRDKNYDMMGMWKFRTYF